MAIEMMAIIGIFTFIGYKIDQLLKIEFPIGVILSSLSGLSIALYRIMRSLNRKQ
jgi:F0F1-type ATP synthase assembly protein I